MVARTGCLGGGLPPNPRWGERVRSPQTTPAQRGSGFVCCVLVLGIWWGVDIAPCPTVVPPWSACCGSGTAQVEAYRHRS